MQTHMYIKALCCNEKEIHLYEIITASEIMLY